MSSNETGRPTPSPGPPDWGRALEARRAFLGKSMPAIEAETQGVIYRKLFQRLVKGEKALASLDLTQFSALLAALEWGVSELEAATGLHFPLPGEALVTPSDLPADLTGPTRSIPVYYAVGAGPAWDDGEIIGEILIPASWVGDYAGYRVNGHSMEPDIPGGSTVVARLQPTAELGQVVVAWLPDQGMVVKRLAAITPAHQIVLSSRHPDYARLVSENAVIVGRVVEARITF